MPSIVFIEVGSKKAAIAFSTFTLHHLLPLTRNGWLGFSRLFVLVAKAQLLITSIVNPLKMLFTSTSPLSLVKLSKESIKISTETLSIENIFFIFPVVNVGLTRALIFFHCSPLAIGRVASNIALSTLPNLALRTMEY